MRERVAVSHAPLLVNIGVRSWKAKRVPVGRRLAKLAVVVSVCVIARWEREGCWFLGLSGAVVDGGVVVVVVGDGSLCFRDMLKNGV